MTPDFWHERWQRGEIGWHQQEVNAYLEAHWPDLGLPADAQVFVPLCGKSLDLMWLASQGHRVLGVELSETAVAAFFAEQGRSPRVADLPPFRLYQSDGLGILCGDLFDLQPSNVANVAAVFDRASLIALPPEMRARYAAHLQAILPNRVDILLITLDYDQQHMPGPPFSVTPDEVKRLYADGYRIDELADFDVLQTSPGLLRRGLGHARERVFRLQPVSLAAGQPG